MHGRPLRLDARVIAGLRRVPRVRAAITTEVLAACVLLGAFIGVVTWFERVDFYDRHFFDTGLIVAINNALRIVFVAIFSWLIYAPGAGIAALIMSPSERATLSAAERGVLGFGIGIGVWHVVMLILGIFDLYYRTVMTVLCLAVLAASAANFARVAVAGCRTFTIRVVELRQGRPSLQTVGVVLIALAAAFLLLRRGLFPGGNSDYYTHYFYYYLAVLKDHGLAPNDVWYQYYYSKGNGLAFLGMLLSDPEAPALTTFPSVVFAAIAMMTVAERVAPNSLWPAAGVLVYLLFYLIGLDTRIGEGAFQIDHEESTALVVFFAWTLCMDRYVRPLPFRVMAAASGIAAAILSQPVAILLGTFAGLLSGWSLLRRRWGDMWSYGAVATAIAGAVLAMFGWSYFVTGLPHDQGYELTLRFADFARLDRWGVIPVVIAEVWIRNNYQAVAPPIGWAVLKELVRFIRLDALWPFLLSPLVAAILLRASDRLTGRRATLYPDRSTFRIATAAATRLIALLGFFTIIALPIGYVQNISFMRLSTFFVPLVVLSGVTSSAWVINGLFGGRRDPVVWTALPITLLVLVIVSWQLRFHWTRQIPAEMVNAFRFLSGKWSLAEAYGHDESLHPFGAINPGALAASRQLPYGTPIWTTNAESWCMVPGCLIEDAISFKMSGRLDEILGGHPDLAKRRLQEAGLNYFLFMKDYRIIDLLPFSRLFAPDTIGRYLGVKWSDGSTFLLTWIGPDTKALGSDFFDAYTRRRAEPDPLGWFRFGELAPKIVAVTPRLRLVTQWGAAQRLLNDAFKQDELAPE